MLVHPFFPFYSNACYAIRIVDFGKVSDSFLFMYVVFLACMHVLFVGFFLTISLTVA